MAEFRLVRGEDVHWSGGDFSINLPGVGKVNLDAHTPLQPGAKALAVVEVGSSRVRLLFLVDADAETLDEIRGQLTVGSELDELLVANIVTMLRIGTAVEASRATAPPT